MKSPRCSLLLLVALLILNTDRPKSFGDEVLMGRPFGVAEITMPLAGADVRSAWQTNGFLLRERNGRALYPVFTRGRVKDFVGELLGADPRNNPPTQMSVLFLFTGDAPLDLTIYTPAGH